MLAGHESKLYWATFTFSTIPANRYPGVKRLRPDILQATKPAWFLRQIAGNATAPSLAGPARAPAARALAQLSTVPARDTPGETPHRAPSFLRNAPIGPF